MINVTLVTKKKKSFLYERTHSELSNISKETLSQAAPGFKGVFRVPGAFENASSTHKFTVMAAR